jgi:type 1 glutamine amidotransferase
MHPAKLSIMPEGLPKAIGDDGMRDLLSFLLLSEPGVLGPAPIEREGAPAPRTRAEIGEIMRASPPSSDATKKERLCILLVAGPKDHGPGEHDYPAWQERWSKLLASAENVRVTTAEIWPTKAEWKAADVVVMFSANPAWTPDHAKDLDAHFARGGGLVVLHFAVNGQRAPEEYARRIGLAWGPGAKFRHGELNLNFSDSKPHPITTGFTRLPLIDESYWDLTGDVSQINVLATQIEAGAPRPVLWTIEPGEGRVFVSIVGHYSWTFDDPLFRLLVMRGIAWTARQPVDSLQSLILPGARSGD